MFVGVLPRNDWCDDILTKLSIAIVAAMPAKPSPDPSQTPLSVFMCVCVFAERERNVIVCSATMQDSNIP